MPNFSANLSATVGRRLPPPTAWALLLLKVPAAGCRGVVPLFSKLFVSTLTFLWWLSCSVFLARGTLYPDPCGLDACLWEPGAG